MNIEPTINYVYQPLPPQPDGKIYAVSGPDVPFPCPKEWYGITKERAQEIVVRLNIKRGILV